MLISSWEASVASTIMTTHNRALCPAVVECDLGVNLERLELAAANPREGACGGQSAPAEVRALRGASRAPCGDERGKVEDKALRALNGVSLVPFQSSAIHTYRLRLG
jgi:hypothetical protein